jgi:hypothetical protein
MMLLGQRMLLGQKKSLALRKWLENLSQWLLWLP